ncbi:MAG: hypothetical protein AAF196_06435 [Planctomycetota bacterium]
MSRPRRIEVVGQETESPPEKARAERLRSDRRGLRILGEIVLWTLGIAVFLTVGRMLNTTAPGLVAGLRAVLFNPVGLVLLFGGGFVARILLRRRRERLRER